MSLLDFLSSDGAQLGMNLMAAGGASTDPNMNFGARLTGAVNSTRASRDANEDRAVKRTLLNSQIAENEAQAAAKRAAIAREAQDDAYFLGGGAGGTVPEGAVLKSAIGAPADAPPPPQGKFAEWSQQFGIPIDALIVDYRRNGGKGIADMLIKKGTPDMQVQNGYAYDKNRVGAGYLPSLTVTPSGQVTQISIDQSGQPVASAPRGSADLFRQNQRTTQEEQNRFTGKEVYDTDPASPTYGSKVLRSNLDIYTPPAIGVPGMGGRQGPTNAAEARMAADVAQVPFSPSAELENTRTMLATPGMIRDPQDRAQAEAYVRKLEAQLPPAIGVPGAGRGSVNPTPPAIAVPANVVELSAEQKARDAARAKGMEAVVSQDASRLKELTDAATAGQQAVQKASRLREIAKSGIYEGGGANAKAAVGSLIGGITGITPKAQAGSELFNAEASDLVLGQIKALGANPSNADRDFIMKTVPQLATSPAAREAMIDFMERKGQQAVQAHKRADAQFRKTGSLEGFNVAEQTEPPAKPSVPAVGTVQQGYRFKGGNPASKSSWEPI